MTEGDQHGGEAPDEAAEYVEELEAYRRRLDGAMFAGGLAWWEMDVETGAVRFHENKADMLDMSPADFDHYEDFTERLHPEDYDRAMDAMRAHLEGRAEKYDVEYRIRDADDEYRWFHDIGGVTVRDDDGSPVKVTGIVIDITQRKQTERTLRARNEQLSLLNRIVRHDIRNDMNVITGWVDLLHEDATGEQRDHLERVRTASQHTIELTDDVRDLMEIIDSDQPEVNLKPVNVGRVVEDEMARLRRSFDNVDVRTGGELPDVAVEANGMLSSVVGNVLNNTVQHNDEAVAEVDVSVDVRGETVVIRVADNGPGVPEAKREEIFQPNVKGLDSDGTGLGLYLVETLVEAYGGRVGISDNDPKGTVVTIELVRASAD